MIKNKYSAKDIVFYVVIFMIFGLWAMMLRLGDAPDEQGRYAMAMYMFEHGKLPIGTEEEIRMEAWGFSYGFQPYLSYIFSALSMKFISLFTKNAYLYIVAARMVNVVMGVVMAIYVRKMSKLVFESEWYQWIFTLLIVLLPQNMFMNVYVNTDSMALMSTAMICYSWVCGLKDHWTKKTCITLSLGIIFCALSYYNAYGFILFSAVLFLTSTICKRENKQGVLSYGMDWGTVWSKGLLILSMVIIGCGWWFVRSYILFDGDFLGLRIRDYYAELYAVPHLKPSMAHTYARAGWSVIRMLIETDYIKVLGTSFVGKLGNMEISIPTWIYRFYGVLFVVGTMGCLMKGIEKKPFDIKKSCLHISFIGCIIIPILLCTYSAYKIDYQPQGRYILPIIIPLMYFVAKGIREIFNRVIRLRVEFVKKAFQVGLIVLFVLSVASFYYDCVLQSRWPVFIHFIRFSLKL